VYSAITNTSRFLLVDFRSIPKQTREQIIHVGFPLLLLQAVSGGYWAGRRRQRRLQASCDSAQGLGELNQLGELGLGAIPLPQRWGRMRVLFPIPQHLLRQIIIVSKRRQIVRTWRQLF